MNELSTGPSWWAEVQRELDGQAHQASVSASTVDRSTTEYLFASIGDLAGWVLGGLMLLWLMRLLVLLVDISPLTPRLKNSMLRFAPVVELTIAVAYVTSALYELMAEEPAFAWTLVALLAGLVALSWSSLRDLIVGITFRVSQVCQRGDLVQVDDIEGRVLEVGVRALVIQTRDGDEAVVPYGRIGRNTLRRTQSVSGAYVHSFVLDESANEDFAVLKRRVVEAAMRSHWASAVHEAKVERRAGGVVEVSVFAHDADHAPIVESEVRRALETEVPDAQRAIAAPPVRSRKATWHDMVKPARSEARDDMRSEAPADTRGEAPADTRSDAPADTRGEGVPVGPLNEDPSDVMDLGTVLGPVLGPNIPPPPKWKK